MMGRSDSYQNQNKYCLFKNVIVFSFQSDMSKFYKAAPAKDPNSNDQKANPQQPSKIPAQKNEPQKLQLHENMQASQQLPLFPVIAASSHPMISLLHIVLKIVVVVVYVVFPLFSSSFVVKQIVVILAGIDFWIVKNVTGRLLVGLRWWVDFEENGDEKWKFECKVNENNINPADEKIFWWTLALFSLVWFLFVVANVISLNITNVMICSFCLAMTGFNLYSYYRCSKAQSENIKKLAMQYGAGMAAKFMYGSIVANYF